MSDLPPGHYNVFVPKARLDVLLVDRGLADSRAKAQALIMAGQVRVEGEVALKPGTPVAASARLEVQRGPRFVSRGGEKLEAALQAFEIDVGARICADVGASTGGFTDCLLQWGAAKVYAIDVGKGTLHWKLRKDRRVVAMEETNARFIEALPEPVSLITVDASFISLRILLPVAKNWLGPIGQLPESQEPGADDRGEIIALIKPQFEAGRKDVSRGDGVIRDPEIHRRVLLEVLRFAESQGLSVRGLVKSPLLGPKGNAEFLAWLGTSAVAVEISTLIDSALSTPAKAGE
jgi:23S rRNA (cytidine1920-2'-O)/16S rRNA (cytidine1409-2'-O)-methyltransferase